MAGCAGFDFAMLNFAIPKLARAFALELNDANVCFGATTEATNLVQPLLESMT